MSKALKAIRRIWAIRCGYDYDKEDKSSDRYIANELCKIFKQLNPVKFDYFFERIHSEINNNFRYEDLNSLERLILMYKSEIMIIQIREKQGKEYIDLIKLPIPNKPLFEKIISGNGEYNDYKQF